MRNLILILALLLAIPASGQVLRSGTLKGGSLPEAPGGGGPVADCTDGTNCPCDTLPLTYPNIFACEDFEHPNLANGTATTGVWHTLYNTVGVDDGCAVTGTGTRRVGFFGDAEAAAINKECLDHAAEGSCEVSGETDCVEDGSGGTYSIGMMFRQFENSSITGEMSLGGRRDTFSVTFLQKFSSNWSLQGGPAAKTNEFGDSDSPLFGASVWHSICSPEIPSNNPFGGVILTSSTPGSPTVRVGAACTTSSGTQIGVNDAQYDWSPSGDWYRGSWACWQGTLNPTGVGDYHRWRVWFTPVGGTATLVFDADIDLSTALGGDANGFQIMSWNHYFNGPTVNPDGWQLADVGARWEDNWVFTSDTTPIPCSAVSSSFP